MISNRSIRPTLVIGILFWLSVPVHAAEAAKDPPLNPAIGAAVPTGSRTTLLVPLPVEPGWQDMDFLAAIPAMTVVSQGAPSLVALEAAGTLTPEVQDYIRRYRPGEVILLGNAANTLVVGGRTCGAIKADSADEASCALSYKGWRTSPLAVISPDGDYEAGLVAAPLAARLRAPLFFAGQNGLSPRVTDELKRLDTRELIVVGKLGGGPQALNQAPQQVTELATAGEVIRWVRQRGLTVADFDQLKGSNIHAIERLDYQITYQ